MKNGIQVISAQKAHRREGDGFGSIDFEFEDNRTSNLSIITLSKNKPEFIPHEWMRNRECELTIFVKSGQAKLHFRDGEKQKKEILVGALDCIRIPKGQLYGWEVLSTNITLVVFSTPAWHEGQFEIKDDQELRH